MKKISFYYLYYTPKGNGRVLFRLEGESQNRSTPPLAAHEFSALAAVLAQQNISYDVAQQTFASVDNDDAANPLAGGPHFA